MADPCLPCYLSEFLPVFVSLSSLMPTVSVQDRGHGRREQFGFEDFHQGK